MQHYKDINGGIHVLSVTDIANDGLKLLPDGCVEITQEEVDSILAPKPAELWATYQSKAQAQLDANDKVAIRCLKAGVVYPADWKANDEALRAIMRAATGDPTQPIPPCPVAFPVGS